MKDEHGDQLADFHNNLNKWKKYLSQLLNVHRIRDVKQTEIHTVEPLLPDPSPLEFQIAIENLNRYEWSGSDEIAAELIKAEGELLQFEIHKLINSILNEDQDQSIIVPIYKRAIKMTVVIIMGCHC
jgi:hypothetical protein